MPSSAVFSALATCQVSSTTSTRRPFKPDASEFAASLSLLGGMLFPFHDLTTRTAGVAQIVGEIGTVPVGGSGFVERSQPLARRYCAVQRPSVHAGVCTGLGRRASNLLAQMPVAAFYASCPR